jgi:hypothetical protein
MAQVLRPWHVISYSPLLARYRQENRQSLTAQLDRPSGCAQIPLLGVTGLRVGGDGTYNPRALGSRPRHGGKR